MRDTETKQPQSGPTPGMVSWQKWLRDLGRTEITGYRWRKAGLIHPINIFGKLYLTAEEQQRFQTRAQAGEFAKEPSGVANQKDSA